MGWAGGRPGKELCASERVLLTHQCLRPLGEGTAAWEEDPFPTMTDAGNPAQEPTFPGQQTLTIGHSGAFGTTGATGSEPPSPLAITLEVLQTERLGASQQCHDHQPSGWPWAVETAKSGELLQRYSQ